MAETATLKTVLEELARIRCDLDYIKEHMVDADSLLTPDEDRLVDEALREHREGRTTRLEDL